MSGMSLRDRFDKQTPSDWLRKGHSRRHKKKQNGWTGQILALLSTGGSHMLSSGIRGEEMTVDAYNNGFHASTHTCGSDVIVG